MALYKYIEAITLLDKCLVFYHSLSFKRVAFKAVVNDLQPEEKLQPDLTGKHNET